MHSRGAQTQLSPQGRQFPTHCTRPKGTLPILTRTLFYISPIPSQITWQTGLAYSPNYLSLHFVNQDGMGKATTQGIEEQLPASHLTLMGPSQGRLGRLAGCGSAFLVVALRRIKQNRLKNEHPAARSDGCMGREGDLRSGQVVVEPDICMGWVRRWKGICGFHCEGVWSWLPEKEKPKFHMLGEITFTTF